MIEITLSSGITVTVQPIAPLERDLIINSIPYPDPPYELIDTKAGQEKWYKRDDPDYMAACRRVDQERNDKFAKFMLLGLDVDAPASDDWSRRLRAVGVELPADAEDKRLMYIQSQVIRTTADLQHVMTAAMGNIATEKQIKAAEASFRREVAGATAESVDRAGGEG